jgi:hypothetical protein
MIKFHHLFFVCALFFYSFSSWAQSIAIDQWMQLSHPYAAAQLQNSANNIWWSSPSSLVNFNPETKTFNYINKTNFLSDAGIQYFALHPTLNKIVVVYNSGRIDIIDDNQTKTVYDWEVNTQFDNKKVNHIHFSAQLAYITTDQQLIVLDIRNGVFTETIPLPDVYQSSFFFNNKLFVSTPYRLMSIPLSTAETYIHPYEKAIFTNQRLFLYDSNSIALFNWGSIDTIYQVSTGNIIQTHRQSDIVYFLVKDHNDYRIHQIDQSGQVTEIVFQFTTTDDIIDFLFFQQTWYFLSKQSLLAGNQQGTERFPFNYPIAYPAKDIALQQSSILVNAQHELFQTNFNNEWKILLTNPLSRLLSAYNQTVSLFQKDSLRIQTGNQSKIVAYPFTNEIVTAAISPDKGIHIITKGITNNLWTLTASHEWKSYTLPISDINNIQAFYVDQYFNQWIATANNGLWMYNHRNTTATEDDVIKHFTSGSGSYSIYNNNIRSVTADNSGIIWVGTDDGLAYLPCSHEILNSSTSCSFTPPLIASNSAGYRLLAGETVNDIAIDAANRKWVATNNGLFLIDGAVTAIAQYYNKNNSGILSNRINQIKIDHSNGLLICNTEYGLSILRQAAENLSPSGVSPLVYPNPVSFNTQRNVAIRNIPENATVKILSVNGQLIKTLKATGSQLVWYFNNEKITTGVYIAVIIDERTGKSYQTKIFFIP